MSTENATQTLVLERTRVLAEIPAPTFSEGAGADQVALGWAEDGTRHEHGKLYGPGVGDNTVAVTALSALDTELPANPGADVWLVATVAEQGSGDLGGARHAVASPPVQVGSMIAVAGNYLGRVVTTAVGTVRRRVMFDCPGGDVWEASDRPSAVHAVGGFIDRVGRLAQPGHANRQAVNVGRVGGGEASNARARSAWCEIEIRSTDSGALSDLEDGVRAAADGFAGVVVDIQKIGRRPAGSIGDDHPLVGGAIAALRRAGRSVGLGSASTDANAVLVVGIPAVTVGITTGGREHTPEEWIDTEPIERGVTILADTIVGFVGSAS